MQPVTCGGFQAWAHAARGGQQTGTGSSGRGHGGHGVSTGGRRHGREAWEGRRLRGCDGGRHLWKGTLWGMERRYRHLIGVWTRRLVPELRIDVKVHTAKFLFYRYSIHSLLTKAGRSGTGTGTRSRVSGSLPWYGWYLPVAASPARSPRYLYLPRANNATSPYFISLPRIHDADMKGTSIMIQLALGGDETCLDHDSDGCHARARSGQRPQLPLLTVFCSLVLLAPQPCHARSPAVRAQPASRSLSQRVQSSQSNSKRAPVEPRR